MHSIPHSSNTTETSELIELLSNKLGTLLSLVSLQFLLTKKTIKLASPQCFSFPKHILSYQFVHAMPEQQDLLICLEHVFVNNTWSIKNKLIFRSTFAQGKSRTYLSIKIINKKESCSSKSVICMTLANATNDSQKTKFIVKTIISSQAKLMKGSYITP